MLSEWTMLVCAVCACVCVCVCVCVRAEASIAAGDSASKP